tara:strand:+ start:1568 stop:3325 length:1758 start_codon:yes stop_codon:yes gene_type:complete
MAVLYTYPIKSTPANRNDLVIISDSRDGNKTKQIAVANLPGSASFSGIGGSGTVNYIPKFSTSTDLVNSIVYETASTIGIGTTAPDSILTVEAATANVGIPVIKSSVNGFANGFTLIGDNYLTGESQFNLGISYSGANGVLSRGVKVSNTSDDVFLSSQDAYSTNPNAFILDKDGSFRFLNTSTNASTSVGTAVSLSERMRVDNNGNVGIGTTSPFKKFTVRDGADTKVTALGSSSNDPVFFASDSSGNLDRVFMRQISSNAVFVGDIDDNDGDLVGRAGGVSEFIVKNGGNIGMGVNVGSVDAKLDILDTVNQTSIRVTNNNYNNYLIQKRRTDDSQKLGIKEAGSNGGMSLVTADSERMRITSDGKVGIGTTSPSNKLTVGTLSNETNIACASTGFDSLRLGLLTFPAAAGWYRVAQYATASARGGARIDLCVTGGDFAPVTYSIDYFKSYTQSGTEHTLKLEQYGGQTHVTKARIAVDGSNTFVEVYKNATTASGNPVTMPAQVHFNRLIGESGGSFPLFGTPASGSGSTSLKEVEFIVKGTSVESLRVQGGKLNLKNLPTSTSGLVAGDIYNDGGTLKIVS